MDFITDVKELEAIYGTPGEASIVKVADRITRTYGAWIMRSHLCILTTVGPEGVDSSPRGDDGPVVRIMDARTLAMPDWRGNNRMDSLRNIVRDPRAALMFIVPGSNNVVRVNGTARVTTDADLCESFARGGKEPRSVVILTVEEVYSQCARALLRAGIWTAGDRSAGLPTVGDMLREMTSGEIDGAVYDAEWAGRAARTMW
ncbi:MAG: pyridoxamine 5'-phosphate oxidase family protein [Pseudomonadota bacterium]